MSKTIDKVNLYLDGDVWCYSAWSAGEHDHNDTLDAAESEAEARAEVARLFPTAEVARIKDVDTSEAAAVLGRKGGQAGRGASKVRVSGTPAEVSERMRAVRAHGRTWCPLCGTTHRPGDGPQGYSCQAGR